QVLLHLKGDLYTYEFLGLVCRTGDVRSCDDVGSSQQCAVFRWFSGEDIECSAGNVPGIQSASQRSVIDQFATRAVHQTHTFLHLGDCYRVNHAASLRSKTDMKRNVIRRSVERI